MAVDLAADLPLVDDPWLNAQRQFDAAADVLDLDPGCGRFSASPSAS